MRSFVACLFAFFSSTADFVSLGDLLEEAAANGRDTVGADASSSPSEAEPDDAT